MKIILLLAALAIMLLFSCNKHYGSANYETVLKSLPKHADSAISETNYYIGGTFDHSLGEGAYEDHEKSYLGALNLSLSKIDDLYTFAVGSEFYTGHYFVEKEPEYNGKKIFYGAGVTFEIALNNEFELGIVHFAGIRTSLNYEDGSYFDFREIASENSKIENLNTGHFFGSYALFQEFVPYRDKLPFGYSHCIGFNLTEEAMLAGVNFNFYVWDNAVISLSYALNSRYSGSTISLRTNFRI